MPGKMARSDPRPSVRVTRGAGSGQHLASVLQEGRKNANIDAGLGFTRSLFGFGCNVAPTAALVVVLGLVISAGYSAGFDRRLAPNESGRWIFALGSALTNKVYGLGGYVSVEPVEAALQAGGLTTDPDQFARIGSTLPD